MTEKSEKMHATAHAFDDPDLSASPSLVPTRVSKLRLSHDFTPFREALQAFSASLRKPARRDGYRGLKIFTLISTTISTYWRLP
ncbi:hypothetical protein NP603_15670, partial [Methylomonas sp. SURF-1]